MLQKITEPQAQYQKEHNGQSDMSAPAGSTKIDRKRQFKIIGGALAAVLFLVVGIAGILVSQRQQQVAGPVAPNAPASKPQAAAPTPVCNYRFTVSPEEPIYGTATCGGKVAYLVNPVDGSLELLQANSAVAPGSIIEYQIPVTATAQTAGAVKLFDTLDGNTTFEPPTNQPTSDADSITSAGVKVTIDFGIFATAGQKIAKYRVKVATKVQPFAFTNSVAVTDDGSGKPGTQACTITLKTIPTGTASCQVKTAYTLDATGKVSTIETGNTILRGSEYFYSIKVQATGKTTDPVVVKDTLPTGITLSTDTSKNTAGITEAQVGGKTVVTMEMPDTFGATATETTPDVAEIIFKVVIAETVAPGTFNNTVAVTTGTSTPDLTCKHAVEVKPDGVASCVNKEMHNSPLSANKPTTETLIADGTNLDRNHEFYYRVTVKADRLTTGKVTITDAIPAALEVIDPGVFKLENGKYVASYDAFQGEKMAELKVKVKAGYFNRVDNSVSVTTTGAAGTPSICGSFFNIPTYACNSTCDKDDQCKTYSNDHVCADTTEGKRCRLGANPGSTSCQIATTPTPTPTPTPPVSTPTPTPVIGCNSRCSTNADCSNTAHICYQTTDGGRCRLDTNVTSTSCSAPVAQSTPVATTQPELPEELPQTGPEDWGNWLKAGLVTLGIGAVLLLLL